MVQCADLLHFIRTLSAQQHVVFDRHRIRKSIMPKADQQALRGMSSTETFVHFTSFLPKSFSQYVSPVTFLTQG
jgi:hypothetical protein